MGNALAVVVVHGNTVQLAPGATLIDLSNCASKVSGVSCACYEENGRTLTDPLLSVASTFLATFGAFHLKRCRSNAETEALTIPRYYCPAVLCLGHLGTGIFQLLYGLLLTCGLAARELLRQILDLLSLRLRDGTSLVPSLGSSRSATAGGGFEGNPAESVEGDFSALMGLVGVNGLRSFRWRNGPP